MKSFGELVRQRREELNMTQEELASKLGYKSRSSVNKIEMNENDVTQSKVKEIASVLKVDVSYLMGWEEDVTDGYYGNHKANLEYFSDKPEILAIYREINESENLRLLFDKSKDLTPEELESILSIINLIKKEKEGE